MSSKNDSPPIKIEEYRDFYDIPRAFIARLESGVRLFFDCPFQHEIDDYSPAYKVSLITPGLAIPEDWRQLSALEPAIGTVRTSDVKFDATRRKEVQVPGLDELVAASIRLAS